MNIEYIKDGSIHLAIIIRAEHSTDGVEFYTPDEFSQQLAAMGHRKGKVISPHMHLPVAREIQYTNEVLIIKEGKLRVDFYREDQSFFESRTLKKNDVILLISGGHGFEVLEDLQMIEVKQGPYAGEKDKVLFSPSEEKGAE